MLINVLVFDRNLFFKGIFVLTCQLNIANCKIENIAPKHTTEALFVNGKQVLTMGNKLS